MASYFMWKYFVSMKISNLSYSTLLLIFQLLYLFQNKDYGVIIPTLKHQEH